MTLPMSSSVDPVADLRALMAQHSLTHKEVAELACVSQKTVESWLATPGSASHRMMAVRHIRSIRYALPMFLRLRKPARVVDESWHLPHMRGRANDGGSM